MTRPPPRRARRLFLAFARLRLVLASRCRLGQRNLQLLYCRLREDHMVIAQQVIRMNHVALYQFRPGNIARAQLEVAVSVFRDFYQQRRLFDLQLVERLAECLRLHFFHVERIHDRELAIGKLRSQRRAQRAQQLLSREGVVVRARLRSVNRSTVPPQGRTDRTDTRAARTFLLPQLLAGTGNTPTIFGRVCSCPRSGTVVLHRFPQQVFVHRAKSLIGKIHRADLGAVQVVDINGCHFCLSAAATGFWLVAPNDLFLGTRYSVLALLRRALGCLQWIDRRRARESAPLSRWLLRARDHDISAIRARDAAFDHQQVLIFVDTQDAQIAHRHALVPHVSRHAHAFEHARRKRRRTDRAGDLKHGAVRFRATAEMMTLYDAREPASLANAHDVDKAVAFENIHQHALADLDAVRLSTLCGSFFNIDGDFTEELHRREIVLGKVTAHRLRESLFFDELHQSDLRRLVAVAGRSLVLRDHARTSLQHRRRTDLALRVKQLRHPDFFPQNSRYLCHFLLRSQRGSRLLAGELRTHVLALCVVPAGLAFCLAPTPDLRPGLISVALRAGSLALPVRPFQLST